MIADPENLTPDEDDDRNPIDVLADEFSEKLRNGESPSITEYVHRRPDLEEDIRELFPTISMMEQFRKKQQVDTQLTQQSARLDAEKLKQLGDFRVIREVGRGGMGVVYAAEQQSLKRFVALKVLAPNVTGSENELRRFKREAEAAARLHHTNIVPIFGTGESDGLHFIVMQLVDGVPLNEAIESVLIDSDSTERPQHNDPPSHDSFTAAMAASALMTGSTLQPTAASIAASLKTEAPTIETPLRKPPRKENGSGPRHSMLTPPSTASILGPVKRDQPSSPLLDDHNAVEDTDEPLSSPQPTAVRRNLGRRYWNSSAGIVAEIADALAYAHEQGVVHRDVKPSNILFDRAGAVWITDFGLARHEDQEAVTRTGDIIGTLRYMAPEQCNGVGDTRSDIYSLGLTLYELITLQPAFPEARHGVLIQQKHDGAFPRPRSIDPSIPRDLETITLKACSTDPAHRYQTAAEFAADLRNFMDEMPVQARHVTSAERLWRWSRRNPVTAALSGLSFALLIAVAAVTAVGNYRTGLALAEAQRERKNAESERNLAQTERNNAQTERNKALAAATKAQEEEEHAKQESERAEANLQIAVRAFEEIIANIASRGIPQSMTFASAEDGSEDPESGEPPATSSDAVVTQADAELLESLLRFFDEFASRNSADLQAQSADARRIIGDIHQRLGRLDDAAEGYREALKIVESLAEASPENTDLILKRARILNDLGVTLSRRGSFREPYELHQKAQKLISESEELMESKEGRFALAETHNLMASIGSRTGVTRLYAALSSDGSFRPPGRRRPSRPSSQTNTRPSTTTTPKTTGSQTANAQTGSSQTGNSQTGSTQSTQGTGRSRSGSSQVRRILDSYEQAVSILTELIDQEPSSGRFRLALAQCFRNRMAFSRMIGHRSLERESLEESIQYLDDLTRDFPNVPVYQFELADTLCLNVTRPPGERDAEYEERVRRAVSICKTLTAAYPTFAEYRALMATSLSRLAAIHRSGGDIDAARSALLEALEIQRELTAEYDSVSSYRILYIYTVMSLRDLEATSGTPEAAEEFRKIAVDFLTRQLVKRESRMFRSILMRLQPPEEPEKSDS